MTGRREGTEERSSRWRRTAATVVGLGVAVVVAVAGTAPAPATAATAPGLVEGEDARLQRLVERVVELGSPGATLLVREGGSTRTYTSGVADLGSGRALRAEDRYRAGSINKTATAVLALQEVEAGRLALDAPVADYLPRLLPDGDEITVRQLLNHTSGLFDHAGDEEFAERLLAGDRFRPRELVGYSTRHELLFPPGTDHSYSNTNYVVVGLLLRDVTGASLRSQLVERVLAPAGMLESSFPLHSKTINRSHARGYLRAPDGQLVDATEDFSPSWIWAAGALVSNTADVAALYRALLDGKLISAESLEAMQDTVPGGEGLAYGLGLMSVDLPCGRVWGHNGIFFGYVTFALSTPDAGRQAVIMINIDVINGSPPDEVEAAMMAALVAGVCGSSVPMVDLPTLPSGG